jgi:hypothetical protein
MVKAFRGEAVVNLPRASNNVGHGSLRLARRVEYFQVVYPLFALQIAHRVDNSLITRTRRYGFFLANG